VFGGSRSCLASELRRRRSRVQACPAPAPRRGPADGFIMVVEIRNPDD